MNHRKPKFNTSETTQSPTKTSSLKKQSEQGNPETNHVKHELLWRVPGCKVHLMGEGEAVELTSGDFTLFRVSDGGAVLATVIKVGDELQWPLTKDEPVVKLDALHYLFSLPVKGDEPLSYGLTFLDGGSLGFLDSFLKENSCFSCSSSSLVLAQNKGVDWKEFAPRIESYNNALAKAIAGGTGQVIRGIFMCSNFYANQVQKVGQTILTQAVDEKNSSSSAREISKGNINGGVTKKGGVRESLKRVKKLSKMTEEMSKTMLDGLGIASKSVMGPVVQSQAGKAVLAMVPGEVLLASLDAVNKILDAAEVAEKQALSATSASATRIVSQRFGESAGEATENVFATAGHCANTAWNVYKIRKAINPASSVSSGVLKNATKNQKF